MAQKLFVGVAVSSIPFVVAQGGGYNATEAQMFASISSATYCEVLDNVKDWTCAACKDSKTPLVPGSIRIVDGGSYNASRAVIGKLRDQKGCVMAFRGSDNVYNWVRNLEFWHVTPTGFDDCDGCEVHSGFYTIWKSMQDGVVKAAKDVGCSPDGSEDNLLYITGHSLGAAVTHLAMFTLRNAGYNIAKTYSFEAPRIGNKAFSDAFTAEFSRKFPVFRITHDQDPVIHLPPEALGYTHVQTEVFYDSNGAYKVCSAVEDESCADQYWNVPSMLYYHSDEHCGTPLLPNKNFCYPVGCLKTDTAGTSVVEATATKPSTREPSMVVV